MTTSLSAIIMPTASDKMAPERLLLGGDSTMTKPGQNCGVLVRRAPLVFSTTFPARLGMPKTLV